MRVNRMLAVVVAATVLTTAACTGDPEQPTPTPTPTSAEPTPPDQITFGVVGPRDVQRAFGATVGAWNVDPDHVDAKIRSWTSEASMRDAIEGGEKLPDVFLASRSQLRWLLDNQYTQPVDELLDERGVEFGDNYTRSALEQLSADEHLQCMPYGVTPQVIFYNKRLVNFDRMRNRELDAPDEEATGWSFDQFTAAAEFASRPARGAKGVHIDPTLDGLGPFILSGGGSVFDDSSSPTSLAFSSDDTKDALERTLELLRNPQVTLDEAQLEQAPALRWFLRGKLGMIAGDRSLVPTLRQQADLDFDVLPMPRLDGSATVGDVTALCMSAETPSPAIAADFIVHEIGPDSVATVSRTGYLQPANVEVALSDDFLQPGRRPEHSLFFNTSVRSIAVAPLIDTLPELEEAVAPQLRQLVFGVGVLDLDAVTTEIDETSRTVLDPESLSESPDPSETDSE
ncbi:MULTISPECIES: ABC transporter substrate-binding protein [unclassified Nocardioides]|uniref:ABC transporter substrate-binding protein n=1 Tax=unclassified Nocardioides TaxID=2615069 RepID=UPI00361133C0